MSLFPKYYFHKTPVEVCIFLFIISLLFGIFYGITFSLRRLDSKTLWQLLPHFLKHLIYYLMYLILSLNIKRPKQNMDYLKEWFKMKMW